MIERLIIENYALIEKLDLTFSSGLTIITGETGAGKSIIINALGLLLGERADTKAIGDKSRKTLVECHFTELPGFLRPILEKRNLDWEDSLIIRREISPSGRSRAFINDTPVNLQTLAEITLNLIDIHSQNTNTQLLQSSNQLSIIDDFSGNSDLLHSYKALFSKYVDLRQKIRQIKITLEKQKEKREFIAFRLEQLEKIKPKEGELSRVEKEFDILSDADQIRNDLSEAYSLLDEGENSILSSLSNVESLIGGLELSFISDQEDNLYERLKDIKIELKDITETINSHLDSIESDPARLARLSTRMNVLHDAIKRFRVKDEKELVDLYKELKSSLENIETGDENLAQIEKEAKNIAQEIKKLADSLTEVRKEGSKLFTEKLQEVARPLGLPHLKVDMEFTQGKITSEGQDLLQMMCSFNKNQSLRPFASIASGGETARLMLSIKSILSGKRAMPTIIFDEVDAGVSGEIADKMGRMMSQMANKMQVIAITHLPQVASKGDIHLKVYKKDNDEKTVSHIKALSKDERINEIATMLSGTTINKAALENAKILIEES